MGWRQRSPIHAPLCLLYFLFLSPPNAPLPSLPLLSGNTANTKPWHTVAPLTLLWRDPWPSRPQSASRSRAEDRASLWWMKAAAGRRDGWAEIWKTLLVWGAPAGNYVDGVETRAGFCIFLLLEKGRDGSVRPGEQEEWRNFCVWCLGSRRADLNPWIEPVRFVLETNFSLPCDSQVVSSWPSCRRTGCRWNGRRLTDPFRATRSEWDPFQVRLRVWNSFDWNLAIEGHIYCAKFTFPLFKKSVC